MSMDLASGELRKTKAYVEDDPPETITKQDEVLNEFTPIFQPDKIDDLSKEEFLRFLRVENNKHWTGLHRQGPKMTSDMDQLRRGLKLLVDEERDLATRITKAKDLVDGMGKGTLTAILLVAYPSKYGVWNNKSETALRSLDIFPEFERGESFGSKYEKVNQKLEHLSNEVAVDFWTLDSLFHYLLELSEDELTDEEEDIRESSGKFVAEKHLQKFLVDNWDSTQLSVNWNVFQDSNDPDAGVEFPTDVGPVDLLLNHKTENRLCVVELKKGRSSDKVVGQILRYMGWIRQHLNELEGADEATEVEGLIITGEDSDRLRFAIEAIQDVELQLYEVDFKLVEPQL